jgi:hypothetical protein
MARLLLVVERFLGWLLAGLVRLLLACEKSLAVACLVLPAWVALLFFCSADRLTADSLFCFSGVCLVLSLALLWAWTEIPKSNIAVIIIIFFMTLTF